MQKIQVTTVQRMCGRVLYFPFIPLSSASPVICINLGQALGSPKKQKDDMIRMLKKVVRKKRKREEMSDSDGEEEIDDFPISRKDEEDIDDDDGNADLRSDMDSISEFETEKSPKQVSKLSPVQRGGRKRRKTTSRSIRSKLNKITQRMKVMEHDVSRNRHQAKKLQEEA